MWMGVLAALCVGSSSQHIFKPIRDHSQSRGQSDDNDASFKRQSTSFGFSSYSLIPPHHSLFRRLPVTCELLIDEERVEIY